MSFYADRCIDLNAVDLRNETAGYVMPGDWIAGASGNFVKVVSVRYIEDNRPHGKDRVEFTLDVDDHVWARSIEMFVDKVVSLGRERNAPALTR